MERATFYAANLSADFPEEVLVACTAYTSWHEHSTRVAIFENGSRVVRLERSTAPALDSAVVKSEIRGMEWAIPTE